MSTTPETFYTLRVIYRSTGNTRKVDSTPNGTIEEARGAASTLREFYTPSSFDIQILKHTVTVEETL